MTLIKSISGIRGTIGGKPGDGLSPIDIVKFTSAYAKWLTNRLKKQNLSVVVGRDARISGEMVESIVNGTLLSCGISVIDLDLASTPTVEIAVTELNADGGIILTASHNPKQWNALKLLNEKGEFLNAADGEFILKTVEDQAFEFVQVDELGKLERRTDLDAIHINKILQLPLVDVEAIKAANFKVAIDAVNSVGGIILPKLFTALGVANVECLYCEPNGQFPHNPEPLPEHLTEISKVVQEKKADVGFVVDPDVDRLAIINEDGTMFGEEYTLVAIADYILQHTKGNTVSNLSSTRALADVTEKAGGSYCASAVGEVNVVAKMKETNAVIGGEGNGGVILPELHYGRDALVGIALFLTYLAKRKIPCSELRKTYPPYVISKNKVELSPDLDVDAILANVANQFQDEKVNTIDGVKVDFAEGWVHLRKSNTEPIIRIYAEAATADQANELAQRIISVIK